MTSQERGEAIALVFADETKERHGRLCWMGTVYIADAITRAIDAAVAAEQERCAKIADEWRCPNSITEFYQGIDQCANEVAVRIRERKT